MRTSVRACMYAYVLLLHSMFTHNARASRRVLCPDGGSLSERILRLNVHLVVDYSGLLFAHQHFHCNRHRLVYQRKGAE